MATHPVPVFLPGKFHEQRSLADYSLCGCKNLDTTEHTNIQRLSGKTLNLIYIPWRRSTKSNEQSQNVKPGLWCLRSGVSHYTTLLFLPNATQCCCRETSFFSANNSLIVSNIKLWIWCNLNHRYVKVKKTIFLSLSCSNIVSLKPQEATETKFLRG